MPDTRCEECGHEATGRADGWRAFLTDDEPPMAVIYCPACAEREFGPARSVDTNPGQT